MNAVVNAHIQETISGISVAKTFRQEQADLRRVPGRQHAVVPHQPAHRLRLQQHLPDPEHAGRRSARRRWSTSAASSVQGGELHGRRLVPVHPGLGAVLVPADQHRLVLEPVPAWAGGGRARLRPDRRRAEGRADRQRHAAGRSRARFASSMSISATPTKSRCWRTSR